MNGHLAKWAALGVAAAVLGACNPAPQRSTTGAAGGAPALTQPGGGYEMDHRRMGSGQGTSTGSPALTQPGGGYEMDHRQMGGSRGAGGRTPSMSPTGGGTGGAEFTHPGVTGTGQAR